VSATPIVTDRFRWDRLTYSSALGYALLVGGLSVGVVLGELRQQFDLSGVIAALHGSTFGFASLAAGFWGVRIVDRLGRRQSLLASAVAITCGITMFCLGPAWPVAVPESTRHGDFTLSHLRDRDVFIPWLHIINAVISEFAVGVWAATYLKEVGQASGGLAAALAGVFGVMMFVSRLVMPSVVRIFGDATVAVGFVTVGIGAMVMFFGPGLAPRVAGLVIVGFGGAPLYPLTVDRLYASAEHKIDSISLGAICILASGIAVTAGPLAMGVLSDAVGLRTAILMVPVVCGIGAITQRPGFMARVVAPAMD
jgi:predicted MFS family arabinose efflux permease